MSKKTFATAPRPKQPTADEIDAYEKGGVGHDQAAPAPAERSKRLSLDLPESVHTRFKTACSATGRKMVSEIQAFIERRAAELESEGGISRK
jgi:ParG protein